MPSRRRPSDDPLPAVTRDLLRRHGLRARQGLGQHFPGNGHAWGDLLRAALQDRSEELARLQDIVKLEYYDQWRWQQKKKK